jgi:hypothetical protein
MVGGMQDEQQVFPSGDQAGENSSWSKLRRRKLLPVESTNITGERHPGGRCW